MRAGIALVCLVVVAVAAVRLLSGGESSRGTCLYTRSGISGLNAAARELQITPTCAVTFSAGVNWADWETPYFTNPSLPNFDWGRWVARSPGRRVVVTIPLIPSGVEADPNWRAEGAAGDFAAYAKLLAQRLVHAGLGHSYIRLGNEGNGSWSGDWIGTTATQWSQWRTFWQVTVKAMRSVPGTNFNFVWCISPGSDDVPLSAYYPGNEYVDTIGADVYDLNLAYKGNDRWEYLYNRPNGIATVVRFARAQKKPLAVPEWGVGSSSSGGVGADPDFTRGLSQLVLKDHVVLQSYFDAGPSSLAGARLTGAVSAFESKVG